MARFGLNKGVGKTWEIKGLVERYAWIMGMVLIGCFFAFVILYLAGVNVYLAVVLMVVAGTVGYMRVTMLNAKFGQFGAMKESAKGRQPRYIVNRQARLFRNLKKS